MKNLSYTLHPNPLSQHQVQSNRDWIAVLRAGTYDQGINGLSTRRDKYCCLGVACRVKGLDEISRDGSSDEFLTFQFDENTRSSIYLGATWAWYEFGISKTGSMFSDLWKENDMDLSILNDSGEFTFAMIADVIEYSINNADTL